MTDGKAITKPEGNGRAVPAYLLPLLLLCGASLGFLIGGVWGHHWTAGDWPFFTGLLKLIGDVFMNLLKMVVLPLIMSSMIIGMASLGQHRAVGKTFAYTFLYYFTTTFLAVFVGLILVITIRPGVAASTGAAANNMPHKTMTWFEALFEMIRNLFPSNLFAAASEGQILGLLVFSLIFGALLVRIGKRAQIVIEITEVVNEALLLFVRWVVWLAPLGVMGLVANRVGSAGGGAIVWEELAKLGKYFGTVLLGLGIHGLIILPLLLWVFAKRNPIKQAIHFAEALLTAFSTASSAASLPITIRDAENKAGISRDSAGFVLPLGATINMDGTALYEAVAAVFIAQAYGIELTGVQLLIVFLTATLAAVGAAAIPEAGLVTMVMVLTAVNVPAEGIGLLLSVDWLLDRFRTTVNVWGDSIGAAIVDKRISSD